MARILAVDDEPAIRSLLERTLAKDGHDVRCAACAEEALAARPERYDLVLLDVMMPGMDGFELCGRIRTLTDAPIVFLTAKAAEEDAVFGLGVGGDDYVRKPFGAAELRARVAAHLRRETRRARAAVVRMDGGLAINYTDRTVTFEGKPLAFAKKEFDIIELLSQNPGQVFDKERIYERVWGLDGTGDASLVAERVRRIRAGLAAAGAKPYIQTVWGCGYKWVE